METTEINQLKSLYFIGAGGIGMSNLVRYFLSLNKQVAGYDRTPSELTALLEAEGAVLHYDDDVEQIPLFCRSNNRNELLVVYTPAVPDSHSELSYFRSHGYRVVKRAELLGIITRSSRGLCVAGTHGKTTTSSMLAHLLHCSTVGCNAFLGGILKNYNSNLILSANSPYTVIEADEYDRSFHWLSPYMAVVTSADPDHLDIYHTEEAYRESFAHFSSLLLPEGVLLVKEGVRFEDRSHPWVRRYTYGVGSRGDFRAENIRVGQGQLLFDFISPLSPPVRNVQLGVPVMVNVENGVAAMALAQLCGVDGAEMAKAMALFEGARRRFDIHHCTGGKVLIDDYGHHPEEVRASISSVKQLYDNRRLTVIFQPHLYSRTRDFAPDFALALSLADEVILLDIYPARELPIEGVTSELIYRHISAPRKQLCAKEELLSRLQERTDLEVVMTLGAGDVDRFVQPIKSLLSHGQ